MFASQLLRILETVPSQVNNEIRASDLDPRGEIMKDTKNGFQSNTNIYENDNVVPIREQNEKEDVEPIREQECVIAPLASKLIKQEDTPELEHTVIEEVLISNGKYSRGQNAARGDASNDISLREVGLSRSGGNKSNTQVQLRDSVVPCGNPFIGTELFENKTDPYVEKDIPGCELPELVVCYKDSTSFNGTDICAHIEDSSKDQNSIETVDEDKIFQSITPLGDDDNNCHSALNVINGLNSSISNHAVDTDGSGTKEKMDDIYTPVSDFGASTAEVRCSSNPFVEDVAEMSGESSYFLDSIGKRKSLNPFLDSIDSIGDEVEFLSDQVHYSEDNSEVKNESGRTSPVNKLSYNSKVERSTIIFDFNSKAGGGGSGSRSPDNHVKAQKAGGNEVPPNLNHSRGGDHGESSFTMTGSVSGLITYTGSIANSCNTSLRSDSSATSTRSFAFPILNAEWNSSPIRMAKGDKRLLRKHKGWRNGLLCCRF